jgi:hypothetical protein
MKILHFVILATFLGSVSLCASAQSSNDIELSGVEYSRSEGLAEKIRIDGIAKEELRIVINDREYSLDKTIVLNNQKISASSALAILREGQSLVSMDVKSQGQHDLPLLQGVRTF